MARRVYWFASHLLLRAKRNRFLSQKKNLRNQAHWEPKSILDSPFSPTRSSRKEKSSAKAYIITPRRPGHDLPRSQSHRQPEPPRLSDSTTPQYHTKPRSQATSPPTRGSGWARACAADWAPLATPDPTRPSPARARPLLLLHPSPRSPSPPLVARRRRTRASTGHLSPSPPSELV
ncbi:hypothetical protein PVAP13_3KG205727 [Panicum virgatum]|uniref:Uncharacterized protein n=1 Tax=Panicum virgatum TaxID=38727 RepID=A0A8T0URJ8_PANVG|nr:hypothetical protein PVAP13_3KG205727 [Panicum virgatum]